MVYLHAPMKQTHLSVSLSPPPPPPPPPSFAICACYLVYGFFATDGGKLLRNASVSEGRGREGFTFYFGVLRGLPPSIRKVRFKTNAGQGQ